VTLSRNVFPSSTLNRLKGREGVEVSTDGGRKEECLKETSPPQEKRERGHFSTEEGILNEIFSIFTFETRENKQGS
jgi:hypothetical protein